MIFSSHIARRLPPAVGRTGARVFGFTLIEIMVAIGIVAIILTIGLPQIFKEAHKDSMRKAVADVQEACRLARERAVLDGLITEIKVRPADRTLTVVAGSAPANPTGASVGMDPEQAVESRGGGGTIFSMKFSDHIMIEFIGVNLIPDLHLEEEVSAFFYPNGTADEFVILMRSDQGEIRKITTEIVTGIADVEVVR